MSMYNFIASDKPLDEYRAGIDVIDKNVIIIPDESKTLNIFVEDDCTFADFYTQLPYIMCIEFSDIRKISDVFLEYIRNQMKVCRFIEIWSTWLDEVEKPERRSINIEALTADELNKVYGWDYYTNPQCLKIYKAAPRT